MLRAKDSPEVEEEEGIPDLEPRAVQDMDKEEEEAQVQEEKVRFLFTIKGERERKEIGNGENRGRLPNDNSF